MNISEALNWARIRFEEACVDNPQRNAEILLERVLGKRRFELYALSGVSSGRAGFTDGFYAERGEVSRESLEHFRIYVEKRCANMPVAYITGQTEFMSLPFLVNGNVFIPRPETEVLVEAALSKLGGGGKAIDIGTGCGNIAVSLGKYSSCDVYASDISWNAVQIARGNAAENEVSGSVSFFQGDMFAPLGFGGQLDLVVSNPPYIRRDELRVLPEEVRNFEPLVALDGGEDGLKFYGILSRQAQFVLKPGGYLMVEVGFDQAQPVCHIFKRHFKSVEEIRDYSGIKRVVIARK